MFIAQLHSALPGPKAPSSINTGGREHHTGNRIPSEAKLQYGRDLILIGRELENSLFRAAEDPAHYGLDR